jgi:hypothetical protein
MKENKFYGILSFLIMIIIISSCVKDGSFSIPDISIEEPNITSNSSVLAVKTALQQEFISSGDLTYTFFENPNNPTYIAAYVVSNDASGNFYKKLIVQDKVENPTAGIEIILDKTSLSETFEVGRKVYIKLDGLSVAYDDGGNNANTNTNDDIDPTNSVPGKYILGDLIGGRVDNIPSTLIKEHLFRSAKVEEIIPTNIALGNIQGKHINTLIELSSAQISKSDITKTFSGERYDEFDGFRTVFECTSEATIRLQTSTFASFKSNTLPKGEGSFTAVLSKDFRSEFLVTIINTPSDIFFINTERCDPLFLDCGRETGSGTMILLEEGFESMMSTNDITASGWINENVNLGATLFSPTSFGNNRYLNISGYRTEEAPLEVWLISPEIDLDSTTKETLTFDTNTAFYNGKALTTYVSSDFTGDISKATWIRLDATIAEGPTSGYGSFVNSGSINMSCLSRKIHIAFKYKGADNNGGITTTFQIDNVKLIGK